MPEMMSRFFGCRAATAARRGAGLVLIACTTALVASAAHAADCRAVAAPSIDWQDCNKSRLMLTGSVLDGANLVSADLSYTDLRGSSFIGANLEKVTLFRASLDGSKADKANFSRIEGYRTIFAGVSAREASFASAELERADFTNADLTGADFSKAELGRAIFKGAVITGAKFAMANLSRTDLNAAKFEGALDFSGAFLFRTRLEGMDLSQATGLQQWQVDQTCGDGSTKLPQGLTVPAKWTCSADE